MSHDLASSIQSRGLLSTSQLLFSDLDILVKRGLEFKRHDVTPELLRGKELAMIFLESSTRTRVSFEVAAKRLGARVINFDASGSSISKGETLKDTVATIASYGFDGLVLRSSSAGAPSLVNSWTQVPVINAGDGAHQHPTQALLDLMTLVERFGSIESLAGIRVGLIGDVAHSRVARSLIDVLLKVGADVVMVGPSTLLPRSIWEPKIEYAHCFEDVLSSLDVVYLLRLQQERISQGLLPSFGEYIARFSLSKERFVKLKSGAIVMHPGPVYPGMEVDSDLSESTSSLIRQQTTNSVFLRMAVLEAAFAQKGDSGGR